ncbi:MAG: N-acetyl-1-D-myo-inositol-2-amino-2-deoxy-alpha-D-glucopyranoside deacetylase, partial [Frankiales bacterium]|nr:N-acetyl-1-D-myo-inositol-2-amino-2-deoxy-alpha-D-glucopyranoside deacetylase [Frankiales bacterium]
QVVVTYNENGGYGHPDHIQAHRVAVAAFDAAADPSRYPDAGPAWAASKLYYLAIPKSFLRQGFEMMKQMGEELPFGVSSPDDLPFGDEDDTVTTQVDARDYLDAKLDAMRAHATQISVDGPLFALSNNIGQKAFGYEHFRLVRGTLGEVSGEPPRETDLFAGL